MGASKELIEAAQKTLSVKSEMAVLENIEKLKGSEIFDLATDINFDFFGLNLTQQPVFSQPSLIWLIPLLSFATSILSTFVTTQMQKKTNPGAAQGAGCMYVIMPFFSLFIAFGVPGAVGFYWACSNLVSMFISIITSKFNNPSRTIAQLEAKTVLKRMKYEESKIASANLVEDSAP